MFESDQHEFDEEFAEVSHPAPPSPAKPPATAQAASVPVANASAVAVAVEEPAVQEPHTEETPEAEEVEQEEFVDPAEKQPEEPPPPKKKPNLMLIGGFAALIIFAIFVVFTTRPKSDAPSPGDLGPGIVAASGLRGHLNTRWDGNAKTGRLVYQLRIEPMEDRWGAGFSKAITASPGPLSVNIRLLDQTGFALCGKEVDFRFDPLHAEVPVSVSPIGANGKKLSLVERNAALEAARQSQVSQMQAAEATREQGKDLFQNQTSDEGQVTVVNAQGALPCSPDQYKRANYWDFNTNFPSLAEQADLLDPKAAAQRAKDLASSGQKRTAKKWGEGFLIQGDDRVTGYDSVRGLLLAEQKSFAIDKRFGQTTATDWASNYMLIHYKCDQHANCALTAAGQAAVLHARLN
ncbi:MAG: hypothetical protein WA815_15965 [Terracidiphilus sp.]